MIGLIDADLLYKEPIVFTPNLEIMKLYSYLKKNGDYPILLSNADDRHSCSQLIVRQESAETILDDDFWDHPNIETGGLFFSGGKYKPFKNIEIENAAPSYKIYNRYFKYHLKHIAPYAVGVNVGVLNYGFIRLHSPGNLQVNQVYGTNALLVYDNDVDYEKDIDKLRELYNEKTDVKRIYFLYPLFAHTPEQALDLIEKGYFQGAHNGNITQKLVLDFPMSLQDFKYFMKYNQKLLMKIPLFNIACSLIPTTKRVLTRESEINYIKESINKFYYSAFQKPEFSLYYNNNSYYYNELCAALQDYAKDRHSRETSMLVKLMRQRSNLAKQLMDIYNNDSFYREIFSLSPSQFKEGDKLK